MASTVYERRASDPRLVDAALARTAPQVFWLEDVDRPSYPPLKAVLDADLTIVGGGYCGLWTAVLAKLRNPGLRVVVVESRQVGWAASGRNGGFCEASLTHGDENGRTRWPKDHAALEELGSANLVALQDDLATLSIDAQVERTGTLAVAVEPHQVAWLKEPGPGEFLDAAAVRREIDSPIVLAGRWSREASLLVHPARLAVGLARAAEDLGVVIFEGSHVVGLDVDRHGPVQVRTGHGAVRSAQVALATNVFPSLVRRSRRRTVPVYDYVLVTEPLTSAQLASIGWSNRQGLTDLANQFHYSRLTADNRILYGGYDAIYHPGRRIREQYEDRPESYRRLASHFLTTFPQLEAVRFSHRWAGVIDTSTQFCAFHGLAKSGRIAYAAGFTGLGVAATRFAAEVMLDRLSGTDTPRTGPELVRRLPLPFPPEPLTSVGIAMTRWALDRADHHEGQRNLFLRGLDSVGLGFDS
jgi:glycine/D-amino acid oxidase-like deaminating enzyme